MHINEKIRQARLSKGWSQAQIAEKLEESRSSYAEWERETIPRADILVKIAAITGIPIYDFLAALDENLSSACVTDEKLTNKHFGSPVSNETWKQLVNEIHERRRDAEIFANTMKQHYEDAKADKQELYKLLHDFRNSLDTNLNVIQKSLSDNRSYMELLISTVRTNDAEIMEGLDHLENLPAGTHRTRAGNKEIESAKALRQKDKKAGAHK